MEKFGFGDAISFMESGLTVCLTIEGNYNLVYRLNVLENVLHGRRKNYMWNQGFTCKLCGDQVLH